MGASTRRVFRRNEDAERDCTSALSLNANNVKALFRRAQARAGIEKLPEAKQGARFDHVGLRISTDDVSDLEQAVKWDPKNDSAQQELKRVNELLDKSKAKVGS